MHHLFEINYQHLGQVQTRVPLLRFYSVFFCFKLYIFEVTFTFLRFTFISILDWMMQGWTCESHLWIILIGQSDIVEVIRFVNLFNELFTQLATHCYMTVLSNANLVDPVMLVILISWVILVNSGWFWEIWLFWGFWWIWWI